MSQSVGFIGLGLMGEPMSLADLVKAEVPSIGLQSVPPKKARALKDAGARIASSAADASRER